MGHWNYIEDVNSISLNYFNFERPVKISISLDHPITF